ncbi:MAG: glycosyltransferase [Chthoniobacterales bacterium]
MLASTAKFLLVFIVTPLTARLQQYDITGERGKFFYPAFRSSIRFLSWFCQGLITLAYPAMGYNPIESRREQLASKWASERTRVSSLQLEEEAKKYIAHIHKDLFAARIARSTTESFLEQPRFTILICFHHHLDYFKNCLDSIKDACSHNPTIYVEILIINDDPSISSALLMSQASALLQEKITLHSHEKNLGICRSANQAIECAKGEWILHLDCDDRLTSDVFSILERRIQEYPHVRYISSRAVDIDGEGNVLSWRLRSESPEDLINNNVASHLKIIRKDLHRDLGLFNPIFEGCQDYEFALRTAIHEPLCFIPDYLYQYRWHDKSQTVSHNKRQNFTANRIRQTYLLALYWINHGISNIQWNITGPSASAWAEHFSALQNQPGQDNYVVTVEATTPYQENRWKLLLVQIATIMIDRHREQNLERTILVTV